MPQVPAMQRRGSSNSLLTTPASGSKPGSRRGSMVNVRHDSIRAQGRWKTLASTLKKIKGKSDKDELIKAQPFRFPAFDVIEIRPDIAPTNLMDRLWLRVTAPSESNVDVKICTKCQSIKLQDLTGFNNTGNICVWPSEEVLTAYCLENKHLFIDKSVLELGAGMTGLAGLVVGQACGAKHVLITDGNDNSVENLEIIVEENKNLNLIQNVSSKCIKWANGANDLSEQYDVIISADCLFFDEGRPQLLECLKKALKPGGTAIIVAPSRSGTFEDFVDLTIKSKAFVVSAVIRDYSAKVTAALEKLEKDSKFIPNLHCPKVLRLEKSRH